MTIRLRLTVWYGGVLALVLLAVGGITWLQLGRSLRTSLEESLQVQVRDVRAGFEVDNNVSLAVRDPARPGIFTIVYSRAGSVVRSTTGSPPLPGPPALGASEASIGVHQYALYAEAASDGSVIVAGTTLAEVDRAVDGLAALLIVIGGGASGAALLVGWWLAGRALAPTGRLARELTGIGVGDFGRRVRESSRDDEVGRLAGAINGLLARIDEGVHRQQAFVNAASHDLRTPIAAIRTELELAQRAQLDEHGLREAVTRAHADAVRLGNLANDLLALAEAEPGGRDIVRQRVSIRTLLDDCVADQAAIAQAHGVRVAAEAPNETALIDRSRIEQAIRNLLANAIRFSPQGSLVTVRATIDSPVPAKDAERTLTVAVLDHGPGVAQDVRRRLFLPFAAHSGQEHSGLGLATAAAAVRAHGGSIEYFERDGGGALFSFSVPAGSAP